MNYKKKYMQWGMLHSRGLGELQTDDVFLSLDKIMRLAKKHHRLAEMDCNGVGYIKGYTYYNGNIDDYARREYGQGVRSAYIKDEETIFDIESEKVTEKIRETVKAMGKRWKVEFQGDPRGATVRISYKDRDLTDIIC